ncbi:hypothetical protein L596_027703 [Steinernema carpocapsae]|uniref:C2H2-type domain-containing protein n=1 Tax=Steinernema carpocapsae TaxID=34508 RepID=A0A4U5LW78_STECR|nr:hypothetical protein L596_027703 [Steinernema carpocapsae]
MVSDGDEEWVPPGKRRRRTKTKGASTASVTAVAPRKAPKQLRKESTSLPEKSRRPLKKASATRVTAVAASKPKDMKQTLLTSFFTRKKREPMAAKKRLRSKAPARARSKVPSKLKDANTSIEHEPNVIPRSWELLMDYREAQNEEDLEPDLSTAWGIIDEGAPVAVSTKKRAVQQARKRHRSKARPRKHATKKPGTKRKSSENGDKILDDDTAWPPDSDTEDSDEEEEEEEVYPDNANDPRLPEILSSVDLWIEHCSNEALKRCKADFNEALRSPRQFLQMRPYQRGHLRRHRTIFKRKWPITKRDLWSYLRSHPIDTGNLSHVEERVFVLLSCHLGARLGELEQMKRQDISFDVRYTTAKIAVENHKRRTRFGGEAIVYEIHEDQTQFCPIRWLRQLLSLRADPSCKQQTPLLFPSMNREYVRDLMAHTAHFFGVHSTKVSHRSFLHTGREQIRSALMNGRNWTSEAAYGYLIYDKRNINELLPRFRRILKDDPNAVPEDYFIYVSQIGNPANIVHYEDKICKIIAPLLGTLDAAWFINSVVIHHSNPQGPPPKEELVVEDGKMDEDEFTAQPPLPCCLWKLRNRATWITARRRSVGNANSTSTSRPNTKGFASRRLLRPGDEVPTRKEIPHAVCMSRTPHGHRADHAQVPFRRMREDISLAKRTRPARRGQHEGFRFKCDYCGLEMKSRHGRKTHMKYNCPERPMDIERTMLKCHFADCEKTFRWHANSTSTSRPNTKGFASSAITAAWR